MAKIDFKKQNVPFTQVANSVLNNESLSLVAKGLYCYLASKPDGWNFNYKRIAKDTGSADRSILKYLQELEKVGYLFRERESSGRVTYHLHHEPECKKAPVQILHSANIAPVSNKEIQVIKNTNTSKAVALQESKEIPLVIEAFTKVNQACKDFYGNTTQRKYVEKLIGAYGFEKVMRVVEFLPKANNKLYNKATTPKELWDKWAKIEAEANQLREGKKTNKYQITEIY